MGDALVLWKASPLAQCGSLTLMAREQEQGVCVLTARQCPSPSFWKYWSPKLA